MAELIVGIDLGTTNSEIAAFVDGKPQVIGSGDQLMLPSCVGHLALRRPAHRPGRAQPDAALPRADRPQRQALMGTSEPVTLGEKTFTPAGDLRADPARAGAVGGGAAEASR